MTDKQLHASTITDVFCRTPCGVNSYGISCVCPAYYLKEDLRQIWSQPNKRTARKVLRDWLARARASGIKQMKQLANTLEEYQEGILAYYRYPISTGPLEGTNNKIRTMQRQAYGFRDHEFFKLKILGLHETKHALLG